jgi:hypothetical protein
LLVHDRVGKTIMEQSLEYIGILDYTVLRVKPSGRWHGTIRSTTILDYLKSGACRTEYILFSDSDDAIIRDDPAIAIDLLASNDCEMLISNTSHDEYTGMPEAAQFALNIARHNGCNAKQRNIHLNAGVYVARTAFLREVFEAMMAYVTPADLPRKTLAGLTDAQAHAILPDFPRGIGNDQLLMRFLHSQFYPRMKIDYENRLALR